MSLDLKEEEEKGEAGEEEEGEGADREGEEEGGREERGEGREGGKKGGAKAGGRRGKEQAAATAASNNLIRGALCIKSYQLYHLQPTEIFVLRLIPGCKETSREILI